MRDTAAGKTRPGGGTPSVSVAKEFTRADEAAKPGHRSRAQRADRKRDTDAWALSSKRDFARNDT
jgi:hypothetical protein